MRTRYLIVYGRKVPRNCSVLPNEIDAVFWRIRDCYKVPIVLFVFRIRILGVHGALKFHHVKFWPINGVISQLLFDLLSGKVGLSHGSCWPRRFLITSRRRDAILPWLCTGLYIVILDDGGISWMILLDHKTSLNDQKESHETEHSLSTS